MNERAIIVGGIPIPSDDPAFLGVLVVHVAPGLVCVVAGLIAMLSWKRAGRHPAAGTVYYWSLSVVVRNEPYVFHAGKSLDRILPSIAQAVELIAQRSDRGRKSPCSPLDLRVRTSDRVPTRGYP
jgi:hypothetical protein